MSSPPFLTAAWTQVDVLPEVYDRDEWEEDEVTYLTLDMSKALRSEHFSSGEIQLLGLNTPKPYARVGTTIMRGQYERLIGSELFLELDPEDNSYQPWPTTTDNRVFFQPVSLIPNEELEALEKREGHEGASGSRGRGKIRAAKKRGTGRPRGRPRKNPIKEASRQEVKERREEREHNVDGEGGPGSDDRMDNSDGGTPANGGDPAVTTAAAGPSDAVGAS